MPTLRQHERQVATGEEQGLVDRCPGRDAIGFGRDGDIGVAMPFRAMTVPSTANRPAVRRFSRNRPRRYSECIQADIREIDLRRHQRDRCQAVVARPRHRRRRDRQKRAAEAVAVCVDFPVREEGVDRVERGEHAALAVILQREVGLIRRRIAPRHHEDRDPLRDGVIDHRIFRRQAQDVAFHDPGGHEEHPFGVHRLGLRVVSDQLEKMVSEHDLTRRAGQVGADPVSCGRRFATLGQRLGDILGQMARALDQVSAAGAGRFGDDFRVHRRKAGG